MIEGWKATGFAMTQQQWNPRWTRTFFCGANAALKYIIGNWLISTRRGLTGLSSDKGQLTDNPDRMDGRERSEDSELLGTVITNKRSNKSVQSILHSNFIDSPKYGGLAIETRTPLHLPVEMSTDVDR